MVVTSTSYGFKESKACFEGVMVMSRGVAVTFQGVAVMVKGVMS